MFDLVHKHKKVIQILLAIIFLPFAFFGIDSYFRSGDSGNTVATVGGQSVSQQEFSVALQERQNYLQRMVGGRVDPAMLDSPELRFAVLDGVIRQRLLVNQALRYNVLVPDEQLQQVINEQPAFQDDGKFSHARYVELLKRQNTSEVGFESSLRRDLMVQRMNGAFVQSAIVPNAVAERLLKINAQQREVSQSVLDPEKFAAQVKIEDGAVKAYYDANQSAFQVPEQARVEYVVLALDAMAAQTDVSAEEVKQFYEQNAKQYGKAEERQASHILVTVDSKATPEQKQTARAKAEQLLKQVKQNPASFADVAKKNSQDPGSAEKGGDLGYFPRGAMVKPFDDAAFQMKVGEISGLVESQFGFHIIKLTGEKKHALDEVKKQVELDLKRQKAGKKFAESAEQLNNQVFEQGDSLKPAADAQKLPIQTSGWISRNTSDNKVLNNPKLLQAIFAEEAIKNKRNTEVIDVGGNTLVAAHVIEYKAATVKPLGEVRADIVKLLTRQQAAAQAVKQGRELLAKLKQGAVEPVTWSAAKLVSRENSQSAQGYSGPGLAEIFKADGAKLPAYAGYESSDGGFVVVKITRVIDSDAIDAAKRKAAADEVRQLVAQEEMNAYVASLKLKADVKVQQDRLDKKQQ
ncbi:MAG: PpiC-type peptidyl-prolyl cis-trans isomerase [Betaproteobacteria bacterium]|nr:PpiC-type peptidyl-prolyl cis-trans isomerase [Betaproteobacteria bacterium]